MSNYYEAHPDLDASDPTAIAEQRARDFPSQNVDTHTRGASDHTEYGISPGLAGGTFGSNHEEALAKSSTAAAPHFVPHPLGPAYNKDPISASPDKPEFGERLAGGYQQMRGYLSGDKEDQEEGRQRRMFGGPAEE
ncbi:hypothetical protein JCM8547_002860 [Rhodosporidiobolus lusitaniae]